VVFFILAASVSQHKRTTVVYFGSYGTRQHSTGIITLCLDRWPSVGGSSPGYTQRSYGGVPIDTIENMGNCMTLLSDSLLDLVKWMSSLLAVGKWMGVFSARHGEVDVFSARYGEVDECLIC
jgi:hypothetical protein